MSKLAKYFLSKKVGYNHPDPKQTSFRAIAANSVAGYLINGNIAALLG